MRSPFHAVLFGLSLAGLAVLGRAQVVLNFDDLQLNNYDPIPANYGSSLDAGVTVSYRTFQQTTGVTYEPHVEFWNTDYGDLTHVAFPSASGYVAEITFTPVPGRAVEIISFDMAGWPNADLSNSVMRLVDASGVVLLDFAAQNNGAVPIEGDTVGSRHSTFVVDLTSAGPVSLQWGTDWNVGIDNIQFQSVAIPEPSTWALLSVGGAALAFGAWRRRRAG